MFALVSPYVKKMDYSAINVELAVSRSGFDTPEMQFRIPPSLITAVSGAGYRLGPARQQPRRGCGLTGVYHH